MATPEGKVKIKIDRWIKRNLVGAVVYKPAGGSFGKNGEPDYHIIYLGSPIMMEVKAYEDSEATALQRNRLQLYSKAHAIVCIMKGYQEHKLDMIKTLCEDRAIKLGILNAS